MGKRKVTYEQNRDQMVLPSNGDALGMPNKGKAEKTCLDPRWRCGTGFAVELPASNMTTYYSVADETRRAGYVITTTSQFSRKDLLCLS